MKIGAFSIVNQFCVTECNKTLVLQYFDKQQPDPTIFFSLSKIEVTHTHTLALNVCQGLDILFF